MGHLDIERRIQFVGFGPFRKRETPEEQAIRIQGKLETGMEAFRLNPTSEAVGDIVESVYDVMQPGKGKDLYKQYIYWEPTILPLSQHRDVTDVFVRNLQDQPISNEQENWQLEASLIKALIRSDDPFAHQGIVDFIATPSQVAKGVAVREGEDLEFARKTELMLHMITWVNNLHNYKHQEERARQTLSTSFEALLPGGRLYNAVSKSGDSERLRLLDIFAEHIAGELDGVSPKETYSDLVAKWAAFQPEDHKIPSRKSYSSYSEDRSNLFQMWGAVPHSF